MKSEGRLVGPSEAPAAEEAPLRLGGKGAGLSALTRAGLPVPPWFVLTTAVGESVLAPLGSELGRLLEGRDLSDPAAAQEAAGRIREEVRARGLAAADREALYARYDAEFPGGAPVAVRSSVVGEDSQSDSHAGQMDTYLHVGRADLEGRVLDCLASAWSARALAYRKNRGRDPRRAVPAVVIQRMVESRASGVLFTLNPASGDRSELVISAGLGLGEGVVSDRVEADTWFVARSGALRSRQLRAKRSRVTSDPGGGTTLETVGEEEAQRPALGEEELGRVVDLGLRVEALLGVPVDVEWALDREGTLFLLQARPITGLGEGRDQVFDNANIVESFPGPSSPLTYSFARGAYEQTFRQASRIFGVPEEILDRHHAVHANLLGLVHGRIYYNIGNWYGLFRFVPGFEGSLPAWEKALGLARHGARQGAPGRGKAGRWAVLALQARVWWRILALFLGLPRRVRGFHALMEAERAACDEGALGTLDAESILEAHEARSRRLLPAFSVSVVNDAFLQQLHEAMTRVLSRWGVPGPEALRNDLLVGVAGMESVAPVRSLLGLAERIRRDGALEALFRGDAAPLEVWRAIHAEPSHAGFREALAAHLARYGDRTVHELKLETPSIEEDPAVLVGALRSYLEGGIRVEDLEAREGEVRAEAERRLGLALAGRPFRALAARLLLGRLRRSVAARENLRLERSRAFGLTRRTYRELGARLVRAGLLRRPEDVFWLTVEEVALAVRSSSVTSDLGALVGLRREEYRGYAEGAPPSRVVFRGPSRWAASPEPAAGAALGEVGEVGVLRGIGCSRGVVRARSRVILDPTRGEVVRGEILVAPMTDPGWVFLMVAASGLVVERGSPLSHTAIIGRELGIPTVVAVQDATRRIGDGRMVELDGERGLVRLLD
ncbi:MAG: hypothetical protein HY722_11845 [Planctomycetes bacterium]|nr:hypothetical protein [Planctomycetota bacterium]